MRTRMNEMGEFEDPDDYLNFWREDGTSEVVGPDAVPQRFEKAGPGRWREAAARARPPREAPPPASGRRPGRRAETAGAARDGGRRGTEDAGRAVPREGAKMAGIYDELNTRLFEQMDRLRECDPEHMEAEIERSKQTANLGQVVIANQNAAMSMLRFEAQQGMDAAGLSQILPRPLPEAR